MAVAPQPLDIFQVSAVVVFSARQLMLLFRMRSSRLPAVQTSDLSRVGIFEFSKYVSEFSFATQFRLQFRNWVSASVSKMGFKILPILDELSDTEASVFCVAAGLQTGDVWL